MKIYYIFKSTFIPPYLKECSQVLEELGVNTSLLNIQNISQKNYGTKKEGLSYHPVDLLQAFSTLNNCSQNYDILHFDTSTFILPLIGLPYKFIESTKILLNIRSVPLTLRGEIINRIFLRVAGNKLSHGTTFLSALERDYFIEKYGFLPKYYEIVPTGVNLKKFRPEKRNDLRKCLEIEEKFVFGYIGSLSPLRKLHIVLKAFKKLTRKHKNIVFLFVGNDKRGYLEHLTKRLEIQNSVIFTGWVEYERVSDFMNACNVGINYVPDNPKFDVQPPTKIYQYLACGLPTLSTWTTANQRIIQDRYNGLLCGFSVQEVYRAMQELLKKPKLREKLASHARGSIKHMEWQRIVEGKLLPFYQRILRKYNGS